MDDKPDELDLLIKLQTVYEALENQRVQMEIVYRRMIELDEKMTRLLENKA